VSSGRRIIEPYNSRLKTLTFLLSCCAAVLLIGCSSKEAQSSRALTSQEQHGERIFSANCAICHRPNSTDALNGPGLKGLYKKQFLPSSGLKLSDTQVRETIVHGRKNMPPMGALMNDEQINDLIAFLKTL
jgi:mono/diheme cytochrome c family protein